MYRVKPLTHTGAIQLHDYWAVYDSPTDRLCVCYTPHNICNDNIMLRPSCSQRVE